MDWWVYQSYVDITTGHPPLVLFHQSIDDSQWKMVWLTGMTGEQESTCRESSRVSEVVPRIIQLKEASHFSKVRSIPLIKAQRLSRWWCLAKSWSTGVEAPVAVVLHTLGLSEKGTKIGLFFKTWITFTLLRVIRTMTLFCHSFWHLIWKYIYIWHICSDILFNSDILFCHSISHSFWHSFWHAIVFDMSPMEIWMSRLGSGSAHWALDVALGVRQWPPAWGPAVPTELWMLRLGSTELWMSRLGSGSAHWALDFPLGVRQCPLSSGSCGWGPAVPTELWMSRLGPAELWTSRLGSGSDHWALDLAVGVRQCPLRFGCRGLGSTELWMSRLGSGSAHWALDFPLGVRQCPLSSGSCGWGPAVPTELWMSRLGPAELWTSCLGSGSATEPWMSRLESGSAYWALDVAVGVRRCPAELWTFVGPAVPTELWMSRLGSGSAAIAHSSDDRCLSLVFVVSNSVKETLSIQRSSDRMYSIILLKSKWLAIILPVKPLTVKSELRSNIVSQTCDCTHVLIYLSLAWQLHDLKVMTSLCNLVISNFSSPLLEPPL